VRVTQKFQNSCKHFVSTQQRVVIPKSQDTITSIVQKPAALSIRFAHRRMLPAVNLDDEPFLHTNKIHDIRRDRILSPELESTKFTGPQTSPEFPLGVGLIFPQRSREPLQVAPSPCPLPRQAGGEGK
jgi:hypothetical protein